MDIGQLVRTIRKARGLPASEIAQRMEIASQHLYYLETGQRPWMVYHIIAVARALGVRPFVLLMSDSERRRATLIFG